jgi:hypothetical protein
VIELFADVGANCDWLCLVTSLFMFVNSFDPGSMWRDWRYERERGRIRQQWKDDWDQLRREWHKYRDAGGYGPPPAPIPLPDYPPAPPDALDNPYRGSDPLLKFYKFYQDVADAVGGPEKKQSIPAGKA